MQNRFAKRLVSRKQTKVYKLVVTEHSHFKHLCLSFSPVFRSVTCRFIYLILDECTIRCTPSKLLMITHGDPAIHIKAKFNIASHSFLELFFRYVVSVNIVVLQDLPL